MHFWDKFQMDKSPITQCEGILKFRRYQGEKLVMLCDDWWPCRSSSCVGQSSGKSSTMQDADTWYKLLLKWLWWNFALYGQKVVKIQERNFFSFSIISCLFPASKRPFQIKTVLYNTFTIQWSIGLLASIINGVYSLLYSSKWTVSHCCKTIFFVQKLFWYFWFQNCGFKWPKWPPMALLASNDLQWPHQPPLASNGLHWPPMTSNGL